MRESKNEAGFSYIDVIIAIVILTVGILGAVAALTASLTRSFETDMQIIAKQNADSALESVFSVRDIWKRIESGGDVAVTGWDKIGNINSNPVPSPSGAPAGIFLSGWTPIRSDPGQDGVYGTADDACANPTECQNADGSYNRSPVLQGYRRRIVITDLETPGRSNTEWGVARRSIQVTVEYRVSNAVRQESSATIITRYE